MIVDADQLLEQAIADRELNELIPCPWPGQCTRELTTAGALERHLVKDHQAVFRPSHTPPAPAPEPVADPPREETTMAPKTCTRPGCHRHYGHSGRHQGQTAAAKGAHRGRAPAAAPERPTSASASTPAIEVPADGYTAGFSLLENLPVALTREDFERLEAIAFLAHEDALVTIRRLLSEAIATQVEENPVVQQVADLRAQTEEVPA